LTKNDTARSLSEWIAGRETRASLESAPRGIRIEYFRWPKLNSRIPSWPRHRMRAPLRRHANAGLDRLGSTTPRLGMWPPSRIQNPESRTGLGFCARARRSSGPAETSSDSVFEGPWRGAYLSPATATSRRRRLYHRRGALGPFIFITQILIMFSDIDLEYQQL
jgi:hypothetical protein